MEFLSDIITGKVWDIKIESIVDIKNFYETDTNYVYADGVASAGTLTHYYSYLPSLLLMSQQVLFL